MSLNAIPSSNATALYRGAALAAGQNADNQGTTRVTASSDNNSTPGSKASATIDTGTASTDNSGSGQQGDSSKSSGSTNKIAGSNVQLSDEARAVVAKLKARDLEVRQHEAAHLAAAGGLATSGASFSYQKGPDGVNYAISGEVSIDVSPGRTPEETIERARVIRAAALAPAEPSGADLAVAAQAQQLELQAQAELAQQAQQEQQAQQAQQQNGTNQDQNQQPDRRKVVNQAYGVAERTISGLLNVFA
ncbi:MAG: hypothetical protein RL748_951 [Pseudomonadota bacterium]